MSKYNPPFTSGMLVMTRNDGTFLNRSYYENLGTSSLGQFEYYQYPEGTILLVLKCLRVPRKGWSLEVMTPDRGVMSAGCNTLRTWRRLLDNVA